VTEPASLGTNPAYPGQFAATAAVPGADAGAPAVVAVAAVAQPGALCAPAVGANPIASTISDPMRAKRRRIDPPPFLNPEGASLLLQRQLLNKPSVKKSGGERNSPRSTERLAQAGQHRQVGMERDPLDAGNAKRERVRKHRVDG